MAQFLFVYHGGNAPQSEQEAEAEMAQWMAWMNSDAFVDTGAPVGMSKTVSTSGVADDGGSNPTSGYSVVKASDIDAACKIAQTCPIHEKGGTVEVAEIMEM